MFLAISTHPPSAGNRKASVPVAERLGELERDRDRELRIGRQKLDKLERQIPHLIDFIADGGRSPGLAEKLRGLENEAESERARTAALAKQSVAAIPLPAPDDLMELVFDLEKRLLADATRGREELRRIFRDGRITLVPEPGGFYVARSEILPLVLLTQAPSAVGDRGGRYTALCCAGAICRFPDPGNDEENALWVSFEEDVAVGWG